MTTVFSSLLSVNKYSAKSALSPDTDNQVSRLLYIIWNTLHFFDSAFHFSLFPYTVNSLLKIRIMIRKSVIGANNSYSGEYILIYLGSYFETLHDV